MSRPENSALIALAELQSLESARADQEQRAREAERVRIEHERADAERRAREEAQRQAAAEAARVAEEAGRRAWEAAEEKRRIDTANAVARAEHDRRLLELQRDLDTELDRRERHRSGRMLGYGLGATAAALAGIVAAFAFMPTPNAAPSPTEPTMVADARDLADELAGLRRQNAEIRAEMEDAQARADTIARAEAAAAAEAQAEPTPAPTKTKTKTKAKAKAKAKAKPDPKRPAETTSPPADDEPAPLIKPRANPVDFGDGRDPLSGLGK